MPEPIDVMHLGRDRVIAAYDLGGAIVDPGPASSVETLLEALGDERPRALLLTHIHLDHAGATGVLVRRYPELRVYVHEVGAPHLVDPSRLLASAGRLYGEDNMMRLWGEVAPVPEANITALSGGERAEGLRVAYTPGHASHHVAYFDEGAGDAYVGDMAGVRLPPGKLTVAPTPPPDIDVDAWLASLETISAWKPRRLCLTHFGRADDADGQLDRVEGWLRRARDRASAGREDFIAWVEGELAGAGEEDAIRYRQAAPTEQLWLGMERYLRRR